MAHPPLDTFQIGWICALPIEAAAAKEMLDENFGPLDSQDPSDSNVYTLGRIGKHSVLIACLPEGQYGNTSATTVANNMMRTVSRSLRIGLMVGIGGGIPSAAHDIRLGDVVINCPEGTSDGIVHYDTGKVVNSMRAAERKNDPYFQRFLTSASKRTSRTRETFRRPDSHLDRLFRLEYDHPATANSCDECLVDWEEFRTERESSDPHPHYGIIASGNSVIKNGQTREKLRRETGALCFEMEAAGLMMDFPCIVIRGICDYADSHKNNEWQGYAAVTAASYAKELLGYIPAAQVSQETLVADACDELKNEIQGTITRLDRSYNQREQHHREKITKAMMDQQRCCHQIFKLSNYTEQKNINPRRTKNTCQWALQSPEYLRWWASNGNDLLWVSADPGCGKSVLARSIVDDCLESSSSNVTICYFFFKDNEEQNHLTSALCSILHQLFDRRPHLLSHAMPSFEKNGPKLREEVDELWRIFLAAIAADVPHKTICVFDALDECREVDQERLIEKLRSFHHKLCSSTEDTTLKFLVTSRPYEHIQEHFQEITDSFPQLHLKGEDENDQIRNEIGQVVQTRVKELGKTVPLSRDTQQRLQKQLLCMQQRTHLWLHLAIADIQSTFKDSLRPDEESIHMIPPSVNKAYEKILSRIPSDQEDTARKIFRIIVAARRPLTIVEMAMALGIAIRTESQTATQAGLDPSQLDTKLRRLCGLFVFINNSKIYLIHQTAREFLIQDASSRSVNFTYSFSLSDAEEQMARICLQYLLLEDLEHEDEPGSKARSFLEYSALHWADHVRKLSSTPNHEVIDQLHRVYAMSEKRFSLWFSIFWKTGKSSDVFKINPFQLAVFNGHEQEIRFLLPTNKKYVNKLDDTGEYPIFWASANGNDKIMQILLEQGADINARALSDKTALYTACSYGHHEIAHMLLERGAGRHLQRRDLADIFQAVCAKGYENIVRLFLQHGANDNTSGTHLEIILQVACSSGQERIVKMLLEHGASVNDIDALKAACLAGHDRIVQMLLNYGADVSGGAALRTACSEGNGRIVQMLLEYGADVSDKNAMRAAFSAGQDKIVRILLEKGAKLSGENDLQAACSAGQDKIVDMLLQHGADFSDGEALEVACSEGNEKIVQVLLNHGADISDPYLLRVASSEGHDRVVQILLDHGADASEADAVEAACSGGHDKILQMLLDYGADASDLNLLRVACSEGHEEIVHILLDHGADVSDQYALQLACLQEHERIVEIMLQHGADISNGDSFRVACSTGYDGIAQMLLDHGADATEGDAFWGACSAGHDKIVRMLLDHGADASDIDALRVARSQGHHKIVRMLVQHGAETCDDEKDVQIGHSKRKMPSCVCC
ncbi:hypothetical protein N7457_002118 [Penicillium paradoxum]|uniref:uncharacterized protein n=1 Tax=Penicillium paradoxum TaxID=176176 RepID=UPI002548BCA0|nr:uncharacterized protein N7457_002118 [Penicillium paradoxum]KAJ5787128.1 hypothetical protein N7457_002118 [Penicillium paradoxum]